MSLCMIPVTNSFEPQQKHENSNEIHRKTNGQE